MQALPPAVREAASAAVRSLLAPGGEVLAVQLVREDGEDGSPGPPWLLDRTEMEALAGARRAPRQPGAAPAPRPARRGPALGRRAPPGRLTGTYAAAMTFSIAARDGDAWGVAVASRFLAVGAVVPRVRLGIGAVATQSHARVAYLDEVLDALDGRHPRARGPRRGRRR